MKTENINISKMTATSSFFTRKIGNTTYRVSVAFSEKSNESIEDKILRLVTSENNSKEARGLLCN